MKTILRTTVSTITVFLILVVTNHFVHAVNALANCPNGCQCNDDTLMVNCDEGALGVLPIALNPSIQRLVIKNNKIKTIDSSMHFYPELLHLDLSSNDLVTIPQRTFSMQHKLQELHLNNNKIGHVNNRTFDGLQSLAVLNLRGNLIEKLEQYTFAGFLKLEELNLGNNRINDIATHALDSLFSLRVLYIDDNMLTVLPSEQTFQALHGIGELYLGTNSFMTIPDGAFKNMKGLRRLDMRGAGLINISSEALLGLDALRYLDISDNRLQQIPTNAFMHLERLEELSIGQNDFQIIPSNVFKGLKNLRRLEIIGASRLERLERDAFVTNTNLEYINLSSNRMFSELETIAFGGLPHLRQLILKENKLESLEEGLVPWYDLEIFDISENPIFCDCRILWLRKLLLAKNYTNEPFANVICAMPESKRNKPLAQLSAPLLGCAHSDFKNQTLIGILIVICVATVTALALLMWGCRRRIRELLKGQLGESALGRKEREYQKTFSEEEYMARAPLPLPGTSCNSIHPFNGYDMQVNQGYTITRPIPVTEL